MNKVNKYTTVLLHGWGTSAKTWKTTEEAFIAKELPTVSMQLPGFDLKDPKEAWGIPEYANFVISKLKEMDIRPPYNFIGHSFGGRISIYIASQQPDIVNKLVLTNAAGVADRKEVKVEVSKVPSIKNMKSILKSFLPEWIYDFLIRVYIKLIGSTDYKRATPVMRETLKKVVNLDLTTFLSKINTPTLIIWGDQDTLTPIYEGEKLHKGIKNSKFIIIKGAGHNTHVTHSKEWQNEAIPYLS